MDQDEFLIQHLTEGKNYPQISMETGTPKEQLSIWWETGVELRNLIKKSNKLYANKKNKAEFADFLQMGQRGFFEWFRKQERKCGYCGVEEHKLQALFDGDKGILSTKRGRGRTLELERRDSKSNRYSESNCVFACYLCNNHKSDIISEDEHKQYFAPSIKRYLEDKYNELETNDTRQRD